MPAIDWPFGKIIEGVTDIASQVLPNKIEERRLDIEERKVDQAGALAQIEVNKTEASHANLFVAGWRPFIGWTGGTALAYSFVVGPLLDQIFKIPMPSLDVGELMTLVFGLLGLGAMRSFEKTRGVATSVGGRVLVPRRELPADLDGLV